MPKKVLIITYYWPPAGGIAVQRWVKFAKYLGDYGWQPVIYTVSNGHYPVEDKSMLRDVAPHLEVIKQPIWEPYQWFQIFSKEKNNPVRPGEIGARKKSFVQVFSNWIRSNFFIPDARKFWIRPSIKFLTNYLTQNKIDAVISTGPPHSTHLIALGLKNNLGISWLADFRDPWTTMDYYQELLLTQWADRKHRQLENQVLTNADIVTVVSPGMQEEFQGKRKGNVVVITNGFDEDDFGDKVSSIDSDFTIVHVGTFQSRINPLGLWKALADLKKENHPLIKKVRIKLLGNVAPVVLQSIKEYGIDDLLILLPFQPHDEAIAIIKRAAVLLLCVYEKNKFIVTGKLFEYLAAGRPILFIGSKDGDAAKMVSEAGAGQIFSSAESEAVEKHLIELYDHFEKNNLFLQTNGSKKYSHRLLAKQIAEQLNKLAN